MKSDVSVARLRGLSIQACAWVYLGIAFFGCGDGSSTHATVHSQTFAPTDDTFINSGSPDNNNGASLSIHTGVQGRGGVMRALIRFTMPAALQGRATVSNVQLKMTVRALGNGTAGPGAVESLQAVNESWVQGNGIGDAQMAFTVGQPCSAAVSGATWNQPNCVPGTMTNWSTSGATTAATVSGQVDTKGVPLETQVVWDSAAAGNTAMNSDVQIWIDTPSRNHGWRISSSDETTPSAAQRFYSAEAGGTTAPSLTIVYTQ